MPPFFNKKVFTQESEPVSLRIMSHFGSKLFALLRRSFALWIALAILIPPTLFFSIEAQTVPSFRVKEDQARDYFKKGLLFYNQFQYVAAREFFYKALNVSPFFHLARRYLGDADYYSGDWNAALDQWEFLDNLSEDAYPLVKQRSEILRFYLNQYKNPGKYIYLKSYTPATWKNRMFRHPSDLFVDENNHLFFLSYGSGTVTEVTSDGESPLQFHGWPFISLQGPVAGNYYDGLIYICDYNADQVAVYTKAGSRQFVFGRSGNKDGEFRGPAGIAVSEQAIYVSDSGNRRVQKFDRKGNFLLSFGGDAEEGSLKFPAGIAFDTDGSLYVVDHDAAKIMHYDTDGNYLDNLTSSYLTSPRGIDFHYPRMIIADEKSGVVFYNMIEKTWSMLQGLRDEDDRPILFNRVFAARSDQNASLYIADYGGEKIYTVVQEGLKISNLDVRVQKVDTSNYPTIAVFLTVNNRLGYSVPGITRREFGIYENDRKMIGLRTDNMLSFNNHLNLVILKENSTGFTDDAGVLSSVVSPLIDDIRVNDRIKVVRIGESVRTIYEGLHRREILRNLGEGESVDDPNIGKGLYEAVTLLLPELGPREVVFLTSGQSVLSAFDQYSMQRVILYAKANNIRIHIISFESEEEADAREQMMLKYRQIATETGGQYLRASDTTQISKLYSWMLKDIDKRYILTFKTATTNRLAGRYVDVRVVVETQGTTGSADGGYFVPDGN